MAKLPEDINEDGTTPFRQDLSISQYLLEAKPSLCGVDKSLIQLLFCCFQLNPHCLCAPIALVLTQFGLLSLGDPQRGAQG